MATLYAVATSLVGMADRGAAADPKRAWLKQRDACDANLFCLTDVYARRIRELDNPRRDRGARPF